MPALKAASISWTAAIDPDGDTVLQYDTMYDGVVWQEEVANASWGARARIGGVVAHDGKMWLLSGSDNAINQFAEWADI